MRRSALLALTAPIILLAARAGARPDAAFEAYRAQIAAAEKSLRLEETSEFRRWLDACDPTLRGWEWRHLAAMADTSVRTVTTPGSPSRLVMSPAGDRLAVVDGSVVRLWSWPALEPISIIAGHGDAVYRATFDGGGRTLITVARDVTSRTWDVGTGAEIARIDLANPAFAAAALDAAGTAAATCAWERDESGQVHGLVWVWDPATGEVLHRVRVGVKPLSAIAFTPDGAAIVAASWDGAVHVLDRSGRETRRLALPDEGVYNAVNDIAISPDGRLVAAASKDRTTRVFALASGELLATLRGHGDFVEGVAFAPDGAHLATCSGDTTTALWRTDGWARARVLRGATAAVRGVAWSPDGRSVLAVGNDGRLRVWDADANDTAATVIRIDAAGIYSTALSPDGTTVAVACYDGRLCLYDSRTAALRRAWDAHPGSTCHAAAYSADGRRIITASWDDTARVWDSRDGAAVAVLDTGAGVYSAAISGDGGRAATSGKTLQVWDVDRGEDLHVIAVDDASPKRLAFTAGGDLVASGWSDGYARVHRVADGALVATLGDGDAAVETVAFLPGDERVATGDGAGVVRVFPTRGGAAHFSVGTGDRGVNRIACAADRIAVATDRLWLVEADRGGIVLGLAPQDDTIWSIDWSDDGTRLATCKIAGVVRILESRP